MTLSSILSNLTGNSASLLTNSKGSFDFDAVTVEQHSSKLRKTENPVESGAKISDHAVLEPKEITINGIMVGYNPPSSPITSALSKYSIVDYVLPIEVKTMSAQAEQLANKVAAAYETVTSQFDEIAADFLIDGSLSFGGGSFDRVASAYEKLLTLQRSGEVVSLLTTSKLYKNMLITSIQMNQVNNMSAEFSIVLSEVFIVETKTATGLKKNLGRTQPKELSKEESESVVRNMTGFSLWG